MLKVSIERCPQNHRCPLMMLCPVEAISQEGFLLPVIDHDKCVECGACVERCPKEAMYFED